jgi:glutathione synthase/RimK-type ligase-like ATP-grasp enzyme
VSGELVDQCRAAAEAVGLRFAGVDLIASGLDRAVGPEAGAVIEVNGTPGLHYHYHVASPLPSSRVAVPVLKKLLARPNHRS